MKTKDELFEELWRILYPGDEGQGKEIDSDVREVIDRLYDLTVIPEPDYDKMWRRVVKKRSSRGISFTRRVLKYAAVVLPLLLLFGGLFLLNREEVSVQVANSSGKPVNAVLLTLSDGSELNLSEIRQNKFVADDIVEIHRDSVKGLIYEMGTRQDTVERYNVLEVPLAADFRLQLSDGTVVYLNSGSKLRYPVIFKGAERRVFLEGEAYFEVARDERHPFRVEVKDVEVEVLGTSFNINAYPEREEVRTTLVSGKVRVTSGKNGVVLSPGEQAACANGDIRVQEVEVREFISWKDGLFIFNRMSLKDIMIQLERWYNLKVIFFDSEIEEYTFTGMIDKNLPVKETFKVIEKVVDVNFSLKDGNVIVTKLK